MFPLLFLEVLNTICNSLIFFPQASEILTKSDDLKYTKFRVFFNKKWFTMITIFEILLATFLKRFL